MVSKPKLIHRTTSPLGLVHAAHQALKASVAQGSTQQITGEQKMPQATRSRTRTWPLPKVERALMESAAEISPGPTPTVPQGPMASTTAHAARQEQSALTKAPSLSMQVMLDQLDRDMAGCPYYEVYSLDGSL